MTTQISPFQSNYRVSIVRMWKRINHIITALHCILGPCYNGIGLHCTWTLIMNGSDLENHYSDVRMGAIASQITSLTIVYSTVYSDADQSKHQSSASLAFVRGIHRGPVNSPHKWPVTRKMFPFDDVIMATVIHHTSYKNKSGLQCLQILPVKTLNLENMTEIYIFCFINIFVYLPKQTCNWLA